jgi:hypothetical protein
MGQRNYLVTEFARPKITRSCALASRYIFDTREPFDLVAAPTGTHVGRQRILIRFVQYDFYPQADVLIVPLE